MDAGEVLLLFVSFTIAVIGWPIWYAGVLSPAALARPRWRRVPLLLVPPGCLSVLWPVLTRFAAREVREGPQYVALFLITGAAWLNVAVRLFASLGLDARADAVERDNPAAALGVAGAMLGITLCYAGANIGEGETVWTTIGPAALASAGWFAAWFEADVLAALLGRLADGSPDALTDGVAIGRDAASAARLAGFLAGIGLVLGRSVAGDYVSAGGTWLDFLKQGWPAAGLAAAAAIVHSALRPTARRARRPFVATGLLPALIYVLTAMAWLAHLGPIAHAHGAGA